MYDFCYDYMNQWEKVKLRYIDTDIFIVYTKTEDIYPDIEKDVKTRFDTSYYQLERPFSKGKIKKVIELKMN